MATHAWRSYERLDRVKWTRLAAAMTFVSFVALFPLLTVAAAIAAATLSESQQQHHSRTRSPTRSPASPTSSTSTASSRTPAPSAPSPAPSCCSPASAGSAQMRDCLRAVWELPRQGENPVLRQVKDAGVLVGLGGAVLLTLAISTLASAAGRLDHRRSSGSTRPGWGSVLLRVAAFVRRRARRLPPPAVRPDAAARRRADPAPARRRRPHRRRRLRTAEAAAERLYAGRGREEHVRRVRRAHRPAAVDQLHLETGPVLRRLDGDGQRKPRRTPRTVDVSDGVAPDPAAASGG